MRFFQRLSGLCDESGDDSLASIDAEYPVFVLALCVFHKRRYSEKIKPVLNFNEKTPISLATNKSISVEYLSSPVGNKMAWGQSSSR